MSAVVSGPAGAARVPPPGAVRGGRGRCLHQRSLVRGCLLPSPGRGSQGTLLATMPTELPWRWVCPQSSPFTSWWGDLAITPPLGHHSPVEISEIISHCSFTSRKGSLKDRNSNPPTLQSTLEGEPISISAFSFWPLLASGLS